MIHSSNDFKEIVFQEMALMGSALSDPLRLKVLELLVQGEKSVELVAEILDISHATASHHLRLLKEAAMATSRKSGRYSLYTATPAGITLWGALTGASSRASAKIQVAMSEYFNDEKCLTVTYSELKKLAKEERVVLLDVRPSHEFVQGHFPGALSIPLSELESRLSEIPEDHEVVAYCRGKYCVLSHRAAEILNARGIKAARLSSGIAEWKSEGKQLKTEE